MSTIQTRGKTRAQSVTEMAVSPKATISSMADTSTPLDTEEKTSSVRPKSTTRSMTKANSQSSENQPRKNRRHVQGYETI